MLTRDKKNIADIVISQRLTKNTQSKKKPRVPLKPRYTEILGNRLLQRLAKFSGGGVKASEKNKWAINFNSKKIHSARSVTFIQRLVNAPTITGVFDSQTIESIISFQLIHATPESEGQLEHSTMLELFALEKKKSDFDEWLWLVKDYYAMKDNSALRYMRYNPKLQRYGLMIPTETPGISDVEIGPDAFDYYEFLVHTVAHELEHVKNYKEGKKTEPEDEFLAESVNVLSEGLPPRRFPDFMDDAKRAYDSGWKLMKPNIKKRNRHLYAKMQKVIRERYDNEAKYFKDNPNAGEFFKIKVKYEM